MRTNSNKKNVCLILTEEAYLRLVDDVDLLEFDGYLAPAVLLSKAKVSVCGITEAVCVDVVCLRWHKISDWYNRGGKMITGILSEWTKESGTCWGVIIGDGKTRNYLSGGKGELVSRMISYGLLSDAIGLEE